MEELKVNFLIKIEDAINRFLIFVFNKLVGFTPDIFFDLLTFLKTLPLRIIALFKNHINPRLRLIKLKCIGYFEHYLTILRGKFTAFFIYLQSEEFKSIRKRDLILKPLRFTRSHPIQGCLTLVGCYYFIIALNLIYINTDKIITGTKAQRGPASVESEENNVLIEFKKIKFEVALHASGHGGGEEHGTELVFDIKIEANSLKDKKLIEEMEENLLEVLEDLELTVSQIPLIPEDQKQIEELMTKKLNEELKEYSHDHAVKSLTIKQIPPGRPSYYRQTEKIVSVKEVSLQIFLDDTRRNRQVYFDFSLLTTNRNTVLFIKDHEVQLKDHLNSNIEPILHRLLQEEEGRSIIKDKIKSEINEFLEKQKVEGKVQEVYIDSLISS